MDTLKKLVARIERSGWTNAELAKRSGVSESHISRIRRGERSISTARYDAIVMALREGGK